MTCVHTATEMWSQCHFLVSVTVPHVVEGDNASRGPQLERANSNPKGAFICRKVKMIALFVLPRVPDNASLVV